MAVRGKIYEDYGVDVEADVLDTGKATKAVAEVTAEARQRQGAKRWLEQINDAAREAKATPLALSHDKRSRPTINFENAIGQEAQLSISFQLCGEWKVN